MRKLKLFPVAALAVATLATPASATDSGTDAGTRVPCASEDSAGPCVWDARHMGNGEGRSFMVQGSGRVVYVSHARAHELWLGVR